MFAKLQQKIADHPVAAAASVAGLGIVGYITYKMLYPDRLFVDVDFDDIPSSLTDLAEAIHEAGVENLFYQAEAARLRENFLKFAEVSAANGEMVLTQGGFTALMHSLGVTDTKLLQRIFSTWDKDGDGEFEFREFLQAVALVLKGSSQDKIATLFNIIDLNGDGKITKAELIKFYKSMYALKNVHRTDDAIAAQVEALFSGADKDFSGGLTYTEFGEMCSVSKFVVGESFTEFLDDLTEKFTRRMSAGTASKPKRTTTPSRTQTQLAGKGSGSVQRTKTSLV